MPTPVSISHCESYESKRVAEALRESLEPLGGMQRFVRSGQRVLLKPNYVMARRCEEAANTHPVFIVEVARLVREAGGQPVIGDSPALGSARHVARRSGLLPLAQQEQLPVVEFRSTRKVALPPGSRRRSLRLARAALDADVVINLPKIKAHGQILLTAAVKNLFGCVRGRRKALWHQQLGGNPLVFAHMLVDVAAAVAPALTLVDGIVAMERTGPTGGDPRPLGLVLAGTDPSAIDRVICEIVGVDAERLMTLVAAREGGFGETNLDAIKVVGNSTRRYAPLSAAAPTLAQRPFALPDRLSALSFSPWRVVRGLIRQAWALFGPARKKSD